MVADEGTAAAVPSVVFVDSFVVVATTVVSTPDDGTEIEGVRVYTPVSMVTGGAGGGTGVLSDCGRGGVWVSDLTSVTSGGGGAARGTHNDKDTGAKDFFTRWVQPLATKLFCML